MTNSKSVLIKLIATLSLVMGVGCSDNPKPPNEENIANKDSLHWATKAKDDSLQVALSDSLQKIKEGYAGSIQKMRKKYDDMTNTTFYYDKTTSPYASYSRFYFYIVDSPTSGLSLRLKIQYAGTDWLFIEEYLIKIDGHILTISPRDYIKRDNDNGSVWETYDREIAPFTFKEDEDLLWIVKAIMISKQTKIRCVGINNQDDRMITTMEKKALRNVFEAYIAMGGEL